MFALLCSILMGALVAGIFGRACAAIGGDKTSDTAVKRESVSQEAGALRESLTDKLVSLKSSQGAGVGMTSSLCLSAHVRLHCQQTSPQPCPRVYTLLPDVLLAACLCLPCNLYCGRSCKSSESKNIIQFALSPFHEQSVTRSQAKPSLSCKSSSSLLGCCCRKSFINSTQHQLYLDL